MAMPAPIPIARANDPTASLAPPSSSSSGLAPNRPTSSSFLSPSSSAAASASSSSSASALASSPSQPSSHSPMMMSLSTTPQSRTPSAAAAMAMPQRYRLGTSFGQSFPNSNSAGGSSSFREAMMMATSFGRDVNDLIDYSANRFASSIDSERTVAPSTSFGTGKLESSFCRNFSCCGQDLTDLHDLLQHYEECHARYQDDPSAGPHPSQPSTSGASAEEDATSSAGSTSTASSVPGSPGTANRRSSAVSTASSNATDGGLAAMDTSSDASGSAAKGKKRSFGQFDGTQNNMPVLPNNHAHQSLRRALIDGGVARNLPPSTTSSVYSTASPFSTPGSSIPSTPVCEDSDFGFAASGLSGLSAFSAMSLRASNVDDHLPACAPPTLFFPAPGGVSGGGSIAPGMTNGTATNGIALPPPAKRRERMSSTGSLVGGDSSADKLDKDGKPIEKPFACPNPGCDKRYKQANGLKYHKLHGSCNNNKKGREGSAAATPSQQGTPQQNPKSPPLAAGPGGQPVNKVNGPATPTTGAGAPPGALNVGASQPSVGAQNFARPPPSAVNGNAANGSPAPRPMNARPPPQQQQQSVSANGGTSSLPLNGLNLNPAALASAMSLIQRGGPLPSNLQSYNGQPIDSAALLRTLQMLQSQMGITGTGQTGQTGQQQQQQQQQQQPSQQQAQRPVRPMPNGPAAGAAPGVNTNASGQARPQVNGVQTPLAQKVGAAPAGAITTKVSSPATPSAATAAQPKTSIPATTAATPITKTTTPSTSTISTTPSTAPGTTNTGSTASPAAAAAKK